MSDDLISRTAAIDDLQDKDPSQIWDTADVEVWINSLPSAQPEYEELTPEEAASEIASVSIMSAWYRLDAMIKLKQMGYAICRKRKKMTR